MSDKQEPHSVGGMADHQHHATAEGDSSEMAGLLDLDAELLSSLLSELAGWISELAGSLPVRRILDLGTGTGTGVFTLLRRFEQADAIAVDASAEFLRRLEARAWDLGVADRVRTVEADLDQTWPDTGPADLVWASASLHHLADPARVLAAVFGALRPGGLLIVVEMSSFPRFLPYDLGIGRPGLEDRCHAALAEAHAEHVPNLGSDWGSLLRGAGFTIEAERALTIDLSPPLPVSARRYAQLTLRRMRSRFEGELSADDLATLDTIISSAGPDGLLQRDDLAIRAARTVWVARRPGVAGPAADGAVRKN
jgi:SAM-dependent methyltransferase